MFDNIKTAPESKATVVLDFYTNVILDPESLQKKMSTLNNLSDKVK